MWPVPARRRTRSRRLGHLLLASAAAVVLLAGGGGPLAQAPPLVGSSGTGGGGSAPTSPATFRLVDVLRDAAGQAFRSGWAGLAAGAIQVVAFMWLRTTMNYQYANGGGFFEVLDKLWREGGLTRLYQGVSFGIIQNPLARFGATAGNRLVLALTGAYLPFLPVTVTTVLASAAGACWRICITPIDTLKTTLQVRGSEAMKVLKDKVKVGGIGVLYAGWQATWLADVMGNYPWFVTNNLLAANIPVPEGFLLTLARSAFIGVCASCVSDTVSNSLRVIKTHRQTSADANVSYASAVKDILARSGVQGLFFRGLGTRLFTNMLQGAVFVVLWKYWSGEK